METHCFDAAQSSPHPPEPLALVRFPTAAPRLHLSLPGRGGAHAARERRVLPLARGERARRHPRDQRGRHHALHHPVGEAAAGVHAGGADRADGAGPGAPRRPRERDGRPAAGPLRPRRRPRAGVPRGAPRRELADLRGSGHQPAGRPHRARRHRQLARRHRAQAGGGGERAAGGLPARHPLADPGVRRGGGGALRQPRRRARHPGAGGGERAPPPSRRPRGHRAPRAGGGGGGARRGGGRRRARAGVALQPAAGAGHRCTSSART
jgi:hypothetical protein